MYAHSGPATGLPMQIQARVSNSNGKKTPIISKLLINKLNIIMAF